MKRAKPLTLRAMAADLGISRTKLNRMIEDGCPVKKCGQVYECDPVAVRAWFEKHEAKYGRKLAPALHPDDPRHRERTAAADIARIEAALERGEAIRRADALQPYQEQIAELRSNVLSIANRITVDLAGASASAVEAILASAVEEILADLKCDDPAQWPTPRPGPEDFRWLDDTEGRQVLPLLAPGDPRYEFALVQAEKREWKLAALHSDVLSLSTVLKIIGENVDAIRSRFRAVPGRVAASLSEHGNSDTMILAAIEGEIDAALTELSGGEHAHNAHALCLAAPHV